jgi:hypothetical protein
MCPASGLVERAASLLEAAPALAPQLSSRRATALGQRTLLPALFVRTGPWIPPAREQLGANALALTVAEGLLTAGSALLGPGDAIDPWDADRRWTACTPVRLAVVGGAYADALAEWPELTGPRIRSTAATGVPIAGGELAERLLDVLWTVALRWGEPAAASVVLPRVLDLRALRLILGAAQADVALAVRELVELGAVRDARAAWELRLRPGSRRHDVLRARVALQLAIARSACDDCLALCEEIDLELHRRTDLRAGR